MEEPAQNEPDKNRGQIPHTKDSGGMRILYRADSPENMRQGVTISHDTDQSHATPQQNSGQQNMSGSLNVRQTETKDSAQPQPIKAQPQAPQSGNGTASGGGAKRVVSPPARRRIQPRYMPRRTIASTASPAASIPADTTETLDAPAPTEQIIADNGDDGTQPTNLTPQTSPYDSTDQPLVSHSDSDNAEVGGLNQIPGFYRGDRSNKAAKEKDGAEDGERDNLGSVLGKKAKDTTAADTKNGILQESGSGSLYRKGKQKSRIGGGRGKLKRFLIGAGISGFISLFSLGGLFSFLNAFKLEHIMQNVNQTAFAKVNSAFDERSDRWFRSYMRLRIDELNGKIGSPLGSDQNFFKSKTDNNQIVRDWYRNMRRSNFEYELYKKNGTVFITASDVKTGRITTGVLTLKDKDLLSLEDFKNPDKAGFREKMSKLSNNVDFTHEEFGTYKDFRRRFAAEARDVTRSESFFKRRHIRNDIARATGQRKWRLFPKTREKIADYKIDLKKRLLRAVLPEESQTLKFLECVLGAGPCSTNTDIADPKNRVGSRSGDPLDNTDKEGKPQDSTAIKDDGSALTEPDPDNPKGPERAIKTNPDTGSVIESGLKEGAEAAATASDDVVKSSTKVVLGGVEGEILKSLIGKFFTAVNIKMLVDTFVRIDNNLKNKKLTSAIFNGRRTASMASFGTLAIANSQINSGDFESMSGGEYMSMMNGFERSEAWDTLNGSLVSGNVVYAQATEKQERDEYCSNDHTPNEEDYHYLCEQYKVGGDNLANDIENFYKNGPGKLIGPIADAYSGFIKAPVVSFFAKIIDIPMAVLGKVFEFTIKGLGLEKSVQNIMAFAATKLIEFAGGIPNVVDKPAGFVFNQMAQGAIASAETNARMSGGADQTPESKAYYQSLVSERLAFDAEGMSWWDKHASLNNPDSLASKTLFATAVSLGSSPEEATQKATRNLASLPMRIFGMIGSMFSPRTVKAATDPTSLTQWSGIPATDIPQQCINIDPLDISTPDDPRMTNAKAILGEDKITLNWETVTNPDLFYDAVYGALGGDEKKATKIFNCYLFDQRITNSIGGLYGSSDLQSDAYSDSGETEDDSPSYANRTDIIVGDTTNIQCQAGKDAGIKDGYKGGKLYKIRVCNVGGNIEVNSQISKKTFDMLQKAKNEGYDLITGSGSFRTMDSQIKLREQHGCGGSLLYTAKASACSPPTARPGYSNHQMGLAIDFNCSGSQVSKASKCFTWLKANANSFGLFNLESEPWHWSVDGN